MASTRKKTTKDGREFYEIRVDMGRGRSELTRRWYVPDGWSKRSIERELAKQAAEFERQCKAGEILTRKQQQEKARLEELEAAKIQTLKQYGNQVFMPAIEVRCSENTRSTYQGYLDRRIYPVLGEYRITEITAAQIDALLLALQKEGLAHATCVKVYTILQGIFKSAYKSDLVEKNPMDKVDRPRPRKDEVKETEVKAFTASELRHILNILSQEPVKWQALVWFLTDTGCRRGEAVGLQWSDIDFKTGKCTLQRELSYTAEKGVYEDTTKSRRNHTLDLSEHLLSLLLQLRDEQANTCVSKWVFTQDGLPDPMHPQSPTGYLRKFGKKYKIDHIHPHKLRHSFASIAITNGADIASVSEKLGHSDKAVTLRMYTHADEESIKAAGDTFRKALENG